MQPAGKYVYKGQWYNDLKHGIGQEQYPDKDTGHYNIVRGLWYHNLLNGVGIIKEHKSRKAREVIYKDNMLIDMNRGQSDGLFNFYIIGTIMCQIAVIFFLSQKDLQWFSLIMVFVYWVSSYVSETTKYIGNSKEVKEAYKAINRWIIERPRITFHMECYHWEHYTTTDCDGNTQHHKKKVVTHRANQNFQFKDWIDLSDQVYTLFFLEALKVIRLKVKDTIDLSPEAGKKYKAQKQAFIDNNQRDTHNDFSVKQFNPGVVNNIAVYNAPEPWYLKLWVLIILDLVMLGWIQRIIMQKRSGKTQFSIKKYIKI